MPGTSFPNSISRTLGDKVGESVSALDFGALANGTHDDATAVQHAIDGALIAGSRTLYFPAGTYKLGASISMADASGLRLELDRNATLQADTAIGSNPVLHISGASHHLEIVGGKIDANGVATSCIRVNDNSHHILIQNVECTGTNQALNSSDAIKLDANEPSSAHIHHIRVVGCNVHDWSVNGAGISLRNCDDSQIVDNQIDASGASVNAGISLAGARNVVRGNNVSGTFDGITAFRCRRALIAGNHIHNTRHNGISFDSDLESTICGNMVEDVYGAGIMFECSYNSSVADNHVTKCSVGIIGFGREASELSVTGATNASPIVIQTSGAHGLANNSMVLIRRVGGNTAANDIWRIAVRDATHFELVGSSGCGAYTTGGKVSPLFADQRLAQDCESAWTAQPGVVCTVDADHQVGNGAAKIALPSNAAGLAAYAPLATADLSAYMLMRVWVKSSVLVPAGALALRLSEAADASTSAIDVPLPQLAAGQWQQFWLPLDCFWLRLMYLSSVGLVVASALPSAANILLDDVQVETGLFRSTISRNHVGDSGYQGIACTGVAYDLSFCDNNVWGVGAGTSTNGTDAVGIAVPGQSGHLLVRGNWVRNALPKTSSGFANRGISVGSVASLIQDNHVDGFPETVSNEPDNNNLVVSSTLSGVVQRVGWGDLIDQTAGCVFVEVPTSGRPTAQVRFKTPAGDNQIDGAFGTAFADGIIALGSVSDHPVEIYSHAARVARFNGDGIVLDKPLVCSLEQTGNQITITNDGDTYIVCRNTDGSVRFAINVVDANVSIMNRVDGSMDFYTSDTKRMSISADGCAFLYAPGTSESAIVTVNAGQELTGKTIDGSKNTILNVAGTSLPADLVTEAGTQELTNKTIDCTKNTLTNVGMASLPGDLVTEAGTQELTNKTIDGSKNTVSNVAPSGAASGDLSGSYPEPTVATVGTSSAANVHAAEVLANAATNANTANAIVKRDANGAFSAGQVTTNAAGDNDRIVYLVGAGAYAGLTIKSANGTPVAMISAINNSDSLIGRIRIDSAGVTIDPRGNVIALSGTTSVAGNATITGNTLVIQNDAESYIIFKAADGTQRLVVDVTSTGVAVKNRSNGSLTFYTNDSLRMTIAANGGVHLSAPSTDPGSVATVDAAQTLTNKTIDGASNTITNVAPSGSAGGDLSGTYPAPAVATVGTSSAANVHAAEVLANAATNANTASAIVKRDAAGAFSAGQVTVNAAGDNDRILFAVGAGAYAGLTIKSATATPSVLISALDNGDALIGRIKMDGNGITLDPRGKEVVLAAAGGSAGSVVSVDGAQTLTNKTIDASHNTITNLPGVMHYGLLSALPTLGAGDANYLYCATDYNHVFRWTGSAWVWGPGERPSGEFAWFDADPGAGWHICDGAVVTRCKPSGNATTESVTLPNAAGSYLKAGTYSASPVPATAPTVSGSSASGQAVLGGDNTHFAGGASGSSYNFSTTAHFHSDTGHTHGAGTLAAGANGEPLHLVAGLYMRL